MPEIEVYETKFFSNLTKTYILINIFKNKPINMVSKNKTQDNNNPIRLSSVYVTRASHSLHGFLLYYLSLNNVNGNALLFTIPHNTCRLFPQSSETRAQEVCARECEQHDPIACHQTVRQNEKKTHLKSFPEIRVKNQDH